MLSAILHAPLKVTIDEVPTPAPGPGELLVEVRSALTCGTDLKAFLRGHPVIPMPGPFGHEFSGVVAARGKGVRGFKEGARVMAVHSAPCLECPYCKRGLHNLCENIMRSKVMGAFAEYVLLPAHIVRQNVYPMPDGMSHAEAALLEPLACVVHGVEPLGARPGHSAIVIGAGPIGLLHVMLLSRAGVDVGVVDVNAARLRTARKAGAATTSSPDKAQALSRRLGRGLGGVDYVIECTGRPDVWESSVNYTRRGGTVVLFGGCPSGTRVSFDTHRLHYDEITLKGDFHFTPADVRRARELLIEGAVDTSIMISGTYRLRDLHRAFERLREGRGIKYAIEP